MRAGRLKDTVEVQSQVDETDNHGEEVDEYNKVFKAKCNFEVVSGVELVKAGLSLNSETAKVTMRYDKRLKYDHVMLYKDNRYDVGNIKPMNNDMDMTVTVSRDIT